MRSVAARETDRATPPTLRRLLAEASVARWCLLGLGLAAVFAAYVSLIPFRFQPSTLQLTFEIFLRRAETSINSPVNFAANILLFVPIGLFGAGALVRQSSSPYAIVWKCGLVLAALALSLAIEMLQVLLPSRTPSLADIGAQVIGTVGGLLLWSANASRVYSWIDSASPLDARGSIVRFGLGTYAVLRTIALLLPFDVTFSLSTLVQKYRRGGIVLNPLLAMAAWQDVIPSLISDLLFCGPIGYLAAVATASGRRRHVVDATLIGIAYVALTELAQVFVLSRTADVRDVLTGGLAVAAGAWLATRTEASSGTGTGRKASQRWAAAGLVAASTAYVALNWTPFDFVVSGGFVRPRLALFFQVPFYGYYVNGELQALSEGLLKLASGVPMGFLAFAALGRRGPLSRGLALLACTVFFGGVEVGQALLPARYPASGDVILAAVGAWIGTRMHAPTTVD